MGRVAEVDPRRAEVLARRSRPTPDALMGFWARSRCGRFWFNVAAVRKMSPAAGGLTHHGAR